MKQEITIVPSKPSHYDEILRIFNDGFSSKIRFVTRMKERQLSFAHDFGLFRKESEGQDFVAVVEDRVAGFMTLKIPGKTKRRSTTGLTNLELIRKYGLACIVKAVLFGATFYHRLKKDEAYIDTVAAAPESRGNGIGTQLLSFAESYAKRKGLSRLTLSVIYENPKARTLYERYGFQVKSFHSLWWMKRSTGISGSYSMEKDIRDCNE